MADDELVLVTGATGYVATNVIKVLQEKGYRVRGTVRNLQNTERLKPLYDICPDARHKLELVEADLTKPETWPPAVEGCKYVMHVASPFPISEPENPDDVILPAKEGTRSVLEACKGTSVKRVVLTSSMIAVLNGREPEYKPSFNEEVWGDETQGGAYGRSKVLAERLAWEIVEGLPEEEKFELAVVNPGLILGPPLLPHFHFNCVDVRDVALAHLAAMTSPEAAGHRHLTITGGFWFKDIAMTLSREFDPLGYNIPTKTAPNCLIKFVSLFDSQVKSVVSLLGKTYDVSNDRLKTVLGVEPRRFEDTVTDMGHACIQLGYFKMTRKYEERQKAAS